ncbi:MAG: TetR/AcrR family transcriptional regulator [Clostridia bacterium]|nr:TetR/AcrR family transcriptional regulator [Clostridia bacterium]MBQ3603852.1 TetR/AcrR family transcriptional regulator [Clostridia bacterium]
MDRRQRKTREAIFEAFTGLLSEKNYSRITVGEIIERADIGRATFYAHFETKDFLLKELCEELFCHVFDAAHDNGNGHRHIFACEETDSVFLHLLKHLQKNDNNILRLLSGENNELFIRYFKSGLVKLIENRNEFTRTNNSLPQDFWINHIAAAFVETVRWWVKNSMKLPPETINEYFLSVINISDK